MNKPTKKKIVKEKRYMLLYWGEKLSKRVFHLKKDAINARQDELEPQHCSSCDCGMKSSEVKVIPIEIHYTLPK